MFAPSFFLSEKLLAPPSECQGCGPINFAPSLTSKYHSVEEVQNLKIEKSFNIFHSNVNGLESKFENLHSFIKSSKSSMVVIALSETSENNDHSFLRNVEIEG